VFFDVENFDGRNLNKPKCPNLFTAQCHSNKRGQRGCIGQECW